MDERIYKIEFDEENHKYYYLDESNHHRELHGVTGAIGKIMGKKFPDTDTVMVATLYGSTVHKEIENYFNKHDLWFNDSELSTEGADWIVDTLKDFCSHVAEQPMNIECEVMVSDFEGTASKVDIVLRTRDNKAYLFDIKTTSHFDRPYCSLQLSVYKKLFEACYGMKVEGLYVLATKAKRRFKIIEQPFTKVDKILNMNKE